MAKGTGHCHQSPLVLHRQHQMINICGPTHRPASCADSGPQIEQDLPVCCTQYPKLGLPSVTRYILGDEKRLAQLDDLTL